MSSLIVNKVKTNMCSVSVKLFIFHTTFVPLFTLNRYNNNYNNNLLSSLLIAAYNLVISSALIRYSSHTTIRYSVHNRNSLCSHATCHKTASITTDC